MNMTSNQQIEKSFLHLLETDGKSDETEVFVGPKGDSTDKDSITTSK